MLTVYRIKRLIIGCVFLLLLLYLWPFGRTQSSELLSPQRWLSATQRPLGDFTFSSLFIHSLILDISIALFQVHYYSEALLTTARILYRSFTPKRTGNCK